MQYYETSGEVFRKTEKGLSIVFYKFYLTRQIVSSDLYNIFWMTGEFVIKVET